VQAQILVVEGSFANIKRDDDVAHLGRELRVVRESDRLSQSLSSDIWMPVNPRESILAVRAD
jgi:hypothetical protein